MAYAITRHFPDGTEEQYRAALAAVHPADGSLPAGQTYHAAGTTEDGWMIVAVFDFKDDWERFRDQDLGPGLQSPGVGVPVQGCPSPAASRRPPRPRGSTPWL